MVNKLKYCLQFMNEIYKKIIRIIDYINRRETAWQEPPSWYSSQFMWLLFTSTETPNEIWDNFTRNGFEYRGNLYVPCRECLKLLIFERPKERFAYYSRQNIPSSFMADEVFSGLKTCLCGAVTECMPLISGERQFTIVENIVDQIEQQKWKDIELILQIIAELKNKRDE